MERREASDVHIPQVERRLAADDPFRDQPARPARIGDSRRVEPRADKIARDFRRLAQNEIAVAGETLGAVQQHLDFCGLETGRAVDRVFHQDLELVPVLRKQLELEVVGNTRRIPGLGDRLEPAHDQPADFFLVIDEAIGVADDGKRRRHAGDGLGDDVEMFCGIQGNVDARQFSEFARPLTTAVDERLAGCLTFIVAALPEDPRNPPVGNANARHLDSLEDLRAALACALCQRLREVGGIGLAVAGNPDGARQVVGAQYRRDSFRLGGRYVVEIDAKALRARHLPLDELHPVRRLGDVEAAALLPAGGQSGFLLQRGIELDAVLTHARGVARCPGLPDQSRRVPRGTACELALLKQKDVGDAHLGQVIGGRRAGDAATDDDDTRVLGDRGHGGACQV